MSVQRRYTSADLELLPDVEGIRYEVIDGELHASKQPSWSHQIATSEILRALLTWSDETGLGEATQAPGLVFAPDNEVAPDVIWISNARLANALDGSGRLRTAPELVVEVLSPGARNERRDREEKLALYNRQGVQEYWIVDCRRRTVLVFRRANGALEVVAMLVDDAVLTSPLLPGFSCPLHVLWWPRRRQAPL
jgi:Uma2 family endonuclease